MKDNRISLELSPNRGRFVSAKIYPDMKNGCSCGSKKFTYKNFYNYDVPECSLCGNPPNLFVIAATVIDISGNNRRIKIRHNQAGERLKHAIDVLATLKQIDNEMLKGAFDVRRYSSNNCREGFKFSNIIKEYLSFNERKLLRGELTPSGLANKKSSIKNLENYFHHVDIALIDDRMIRNFYESFTSRLRTRDKAIQELKTICRFALEDGKIDRMPKFPEISAARMVSAENFLDIETQKIVISNVSNDIYKKAIQVLAMYALRPCEVRSLKWKDIDKKRNVFFVRSHFSKGIDISGRKSQSQAAHELPIIPEFESILNSLPQSINPEDYIFKGAKGSHIGTNALTRAWNEACVKAKVKKVTLYQGTKHSTLSELSSYTPDSLFVKFTGHTTPKMLRRYAQSSTEEVRRLLLKGK